MTAQTNLQIPQSLILRLASANTQRRKQLKYWTTRSDIDDSTVVDSTIESQPEPQRPSLPFEPSVAGPSASTPREASVAPSRTGKTVKSRVSFSTAVISDMNVTRKGGEARTQYEESVVGKLAPVSVPPLPRVAHTHENFRCPYCDLELRSPLMRDRRAWKEHVFRDLRPYVCTFPSCASGSRLYHARHDWIHHEKQMHRRRWICSDGCNVDFPSQQSFVDHLQANHDGRVERRQLSLLLTLSERPLDDETIDRCPVCPMTLSLPSLYSHIAQHLEQLSLFVLFSYLDETNTEDGKEASVQAQDHHDDSSGDFSESSDVDSTYIESSGGVDMDPVVTESSEDIQFASQNVPDWDSLLGVARAISQPDQPDRILLDLQDKQSMRRRAEGSGDANTQMQSSDEETDNGRDQLEYYNARVGRAPNSQPPAISSQPSPTRSLSQASQAGSDIDHIPSFSTRESIPRPSRPSRTERHYRPQSTLPSVSYLDTAQTNGPPPSRPERQPSSSYDSNPFAASASANDPWDPRNMRDALPSPRGPNVRYNYPPQQATQSIQQALNVAFDTDSEEEVQRYDPRRR